MSENTDTTRTASSHVTVEIFDQNYRLRGQNPEYIQHLAGIVDSKMRLVASQGKTVDSLRVAVLAALNIADELARAQEELESLKGNVNQAQSNIRNRANSLNGLLDSLLTEERRIG
jgi:cell division protein ZapA